MWDLKRGYCVNKEGVDSGRKGGEEGRESRTSLLPAMKKEHGTLLIRQNRIVILSQWLQKSNGSSLKVCLHRAGGPQLGEISRLVGVTCVSV